MLKIEAAKILTLSISHLHPETIAMIERRKGDIPRGPSIGIRPEGYFIETGLGCDDILTQDVSEGAHLALGATAPDITLLRAVGRGLHAEWICVHVDGIEYSDVLPAYDDDGKLQMPTDPQWCAGLSEFRVLPSGSPIIAPSLPVLALIEAGEVPHQTVRRPIALDGEAYRNGRLQLHQPPAAVEHQRTASDWAVAYGAGTSVYDLIADAGYENLQAMAEAMLANAAPVVVLMAEFYHNGTIAATGLPPVTVGEIFDTHDLWPEDVSAPAMA